MHLTISVPENFWKIPKSLRIGRKHYNASYQRASSLLGKSAMNKELLINLPAMVQLNHNNDQFVIFNIRNNSIVSNSIRPKCRQVSRQSLTVNSWIIERQQPLMQKCQNALLNGPIQFQQLLFGFRRPFNRPSLICQTLVLSLFRP